MRYRLLSTTGLKVDEVGYGLRGTGGWADASEIVWQFAGEPNLSADGRTLYYAHHYYDAETSELHESDIYVSYRIEP